MQTHVLAVGTHRLQSTAFSVTEAEMTDTLRRKIFEHIGISVVFLRFRHRCVTLNTPSVRVPSIMRQCHGLDIFQIHGCNHVLSVGMHSLQSSAWILGHGLTEAETTDTGV